MIYLPAFLGLLVFYHAPYDLARVLARMDAQLAEFRATAVRTENGNVLGKLLEAQKKERESWRFIQGTGRVAGVNGTAVLLVLPRRNHLIQAEARDPDDPILLKLRKGNAVRVFGKPNSGGLVLPLKECTFTVAYSTRKK